MNLRVYALNLTGAFGKLANRQTVLDVGRTESITKLTLQAGGEAGFEAALFVRRRDQSLPHWTGFLEEGFAGVGEYLSANSPNSAVLVVKTAGRFYALPFGYGRTMLRWERVVPGFGIRTALGLIDRGNIASIDSKVVDHTTFFTNIQSTRGVPIHDFAMNVDRDMLRGVYGFPQVSSDLCSKVLGSEALYINPRTDFAGIGKVLRQCWSAYKAEGYKKYFEWIDNVRPANQPSVIDALNLKLEKALANGEPSVSLGAPGPLPRSNVGGFRISRRRPKELIPEVGIEEYRARFRDPSQLSIERVKADRVSLVAEDSGQVIERWSVFRWLMFEVDHQGQTYVLQDGQYYEVDTDFRRTLDKAVKQIRRTKIVLPPWIRANHPKELDYNRWLQGQTPSSFLFDQQLATDFEGRSSLEFCDVAVLTNARAWLIHVKKYDGSNVLSHLFSQGAVAAEALVADERFRREIRSKLPARLRPCLPAAGVQADKLEVVMAMAIKNPGRRALTSLLPFFSKLNLRQRAQGLRRMGIDCTVGVIDYQP